MNARASTRERGAWAEDRACEYLARHGLVALLRNYRCRHGEIDLVLRDGATLVFAEVRYRAHRDRVSGAQSVDAAKQRRLRASAEHFLQRHREHVECACRFDVLDICGPEHAPQVDWIQDAFQ